MPGRIVAGILLIFAGIAVVAPTASPRAPHPPIAVWLDEGHELINRTAAEHLPAEVPAFFRDAVDRLAYLGPEPDRWRRMSELALKQSQEPGHFIHLDELDRLGDDFAFPPGRYDYIRSLADARAREREETGESADHLLPEVVGFQPYVAMEMYDRLKVAFRGYRLLSAAGEDSSLVEGSAITYAGWLGHFVADAAQPMHTSTQYDGWVGPNPRGYSGPGIHLRFEGTFIQQNMEKLDVSDLIREPTRLDNTWQAYLEYLRASHDLTRRVYQLDLAGGFAEDGTEEGVEFARERLAAAATMLRDMWYTAWLESES